MAFGRVLPSLVDRDRTGGHVSVVQGAVEDPECRLRLVVGNYDVH